MQITARYKKTVKGYARYAVPNGGMVVFSANLFGKGVEPPATIVLEHAAFAVVDAESKDHAKLEAAAAKTAAQLANSGLGPKNSLSSHRSETANDSWPDALELSKHER